MLIKNREDISTILENITVSFQGQPLLIFSGSHGTQIWVQVGSERPDCDNPDIIEIGKGGKAYISEHATDDEIVKKVLGLCLAYVEHEMREGFYYKGVRCFGPHISLEAMMEAAQHTKGRQRIDDGLTERGDPFNWVAEIDDGLTQKELFKE